METEHVPEEILLQILGNLPAKSLVRFNSVCKAWNALIKNPYFLKKHYNLKNHKEDPLLIFVRSRQDRSELEYKEQSFTLDSDNPVLPRCVSIPDHDSYQGVRGPSAFSCNGILCLEHQNFYTSTVCLYNPITSDSLILPPSLYSDEFFGTEHVGFGLDNSGNDYKVVRIRSAKNYFYGGGQQQPVFEMYKFSTERWSKVEVDLKFEDSYRSQTGGVYLNGFFYWLYESDTNRASILTFDFHAETFEKIELCDDLIFSSANRRTGGCHGDLFVAAVDDSLAVCSIEKIVNVGSMVDVWIMKEYGNKSSWTKKFSVEISVHEFGLFGGVVNLGFHGTSLVLLCKNSLARRHKLVACTPEGGGEGEGEGGTKFTIRTLLDFDGYDDVNGAIFRPTLVSLP